MSNQNVGFLTTRLINLLLWSQFSITPRSLPSSDPQDRLVQQYLTFNVKFLNIGTPENFAVISLNLEQTCSALCQKDANEIVNSEDPDQTATICGQKIRTITECKIPVFSHKGDPMFLE